MYTKQSEVSTMSATIKQTVNGYLVCTADGCSWQKYNLTAALDFCRLLGFKPVLEVRV